MARISKLFQLKYVVIEYILIILDFHHALNFFWATNRLTRNFCIKSFKAIERSFNNEGFITFKIDLDTSYLIFEKLYMDVMQRWKSNRKLTIEITASEYQSFDMFHQIFKAITN